MKKLFLSLITFIAVAAFAQDKTVVADANAQKRTLNASFTGISVSDGVDLYLTQGNEESVAVSNGMLIKRFDVIVARQSTDQHHQRALGQVKVGHQHINNFEFKARRDEDVGIAAARLQDLPRWCMQRSGLQRTQGGRANAHHALAGCFGGLNRGDG